jgi:ubiquinone/menaquinone biosynthesis C-methylase UbiE
MVSEVSIASHYARGGIEADILAALRAAGKDLDHLSPDDLAAIDEFHIGGREATLSLLEQLAPRRDSHILDIGSGIGGPARYLAATHGSSVVGVDLTDEFVAVATTLTRLCGLGGLATFQQGDAARLPFPDRSFDAAYMISVAMNIPDKSMLFAGVRRVLKPGARFALSDVFRGEGEARYPLPWSAGEATNFMASLADYRQWLADAGFQVEGTRDRTSFALDHFAKLAARFDGDRGAPPLGLHLVLGRDAVRKTANLVRGLKSGAFYPAEIVATVPATG